MSEGVARVEHGEDHLRALAVLQVRLRHDADLRDVVSVGKTMQI